MLLKLLVTCTLAVVAASTCEECGRQIDSAIERAKTSVVEVQTTLAQTPTPMPDRDGKPSEKRQIALDLKKPPQGIQDKQNLKNKKQIWVEVEGIAAEERATFGQRFPAQQDCYFATMNAAVQVSARSWSGYALNKLAAGIATAPLGVITTGTVVGDGALLIGSYLVHLGFSEDFDETTIEFVAEETAAFILGRAVGEYAGEVLSKAVDAKAIEDLLKKDDVVADKAEGRGDGRKYGSSDASIVMIALYNPYTHYVVVAVSSDCGGRYLIRYEADGNALTVGPVEILPVPN